MLSPLFLQRQPTVLRGVVLAILVATTATTAPAQVFRTGVILSPMSAATPAEAATAETVRLLTGLAKIEADLQLGLLYQHEGLTHPKGSPFTWPRAETWPAIKDGIIAAGAADLEPLLAQLETNGDAATFAEVSVGLAKARTALNPTTEDLVVTIAGQSRAIAAGLGATTADDYQSAWSLLMVTRGHVDLLARNPDPEIAKAAAGIAMALDDLIISAPYPTQTSPAGVDATAILDAAIALESVGGST
jgi:hypothetical protein